ncbi:MAG TPA: thermonuclease family protein [Polyangiaceae bacterium]|nr:thermonuclease family protein [Polyangiaceae bacterium]
MGLLEIQGTLEVSQFWPAGTSDGDTARVAMNQVTFDGTVTHAFEGAHVHGRINRAVIDGNGAITVRMQGIDAPELHYLPAVSKAKAKKPNANFRQYYGRAAAAALGGFVSVLGKTQVNCRVVTQVSEPNDVFDMYGRFIGDVIVTGTDGNEVDLNLWMVQNGWAFPTFYTSMTKDEITVAKQHDLADFVSDARVDFEPGALVFLEAASTLCNKANQIITAW